MKRDTVFILLFIFVVLGLFGTIEMEDRQAAHEHKVETINAARVK